MDPGRPYNNPALAAPYADPSRGEARVIPSGNSPQLPSLPSIRYLHPDLPPMNVPHHTAATNSQHLSSASYAVPSSSSGVGTRPPTDGSDAEDEPSGPPKKKRRRQALSCTECKRRKIKCDRNQPCGPCSRRGEQSKCQWHIIEPMEKYVTRTEYDELKSRFEHLESTLARLMPAFSSAYGLRPSIPSPTMPKAAVSTVDPTQPTMIAPYHTHGASVYQGYRTLPTASPTFRSEHQPPPTQLLPPSTRSPLSLNPPTASFHPGPPTPTQRQFPRATSTSPTLSSSSRFPESRAPTSRRASLSLAAITSPFTPERPTFSQPKNLYAQTRLQLGQRLRKRSAHPGPVTETDHVHLRVLRCPYTPTLDVRRARQLPRWEQPLSLRQRRRQSLSISLNRIDHLLVYPP